jgi:hypothetical protein
MQRDCDRADVKMQFRNGFRSVFVTQAARFVCALKHTGLRGAADRGVRETDIIRTENSKTSDGLDGYPVAIEQNQRVLE